MKLFDLFTDLFLELDLLFDFDIDLLQHFKKVLLLLLFNKFTKLICNEGIKLLLILFYLFLFILLFILLLFILLLALLAAMLLILLL